jgi:mono/diheme cytochrome c family protein
MSHGLPPDSPKEKPINPQLAETGRKLVGVDGGFSCIACHGVKDRQPLQVFEAQGVNFSSVGARIQPDYYLRWMLDPLRVNPQTRMPKYFDEDARSVLVDVLEGDAKKQIEAIHQYLLLGDRMKLPVMQ